MVLDGLVRGIDKLGNDADDEAADFGRRKGCPLSMMFIVALYLPWCRYLAAQGRCSASVIC